MQFILGNKLFRQQHQERNPTHPVIFASVSAEFYQRFKTIACCLLPVPSPHPMN
ncbi:hypothetical protein [Coleofasciculus sp. F4-SAH-05]|uniref:hypothetical protein n=1 Tax=Coleofasciculus sp. F4-SAH-05 TaxID=3069525 RepID=UPI0032F6032D